MRAALFQVVTFATHPFRGNPAFVLRNVGNASDRVLMGMSDLLRADVIAVIDDASQAEPSLRFFTPGGPHPGAGHATMAAAHVALSQSADGNAAMDFKLANGDRRSARRDGDRIAVRFPQMAASGIDCIAPMQAALGARPSETWVSAFGYIGIFSDQATVAGLRPDMARVAAFDRSAVIATAPASDGADVVIRVFAPNVGLPEDPVCGTAHRIIIPYWSRRLGKTRIHSRHLSPRGGDLWCEPEGEDVVIAGENCTSFSGTAELPEP